MVKRICREHRTKLALSLIAGVFFSVLSLILTDIYESPDGVLLPILLGLLLALTIGMAVRHLTVQNRGFPILILAAGLLFGMLLRVVCLTHESLDYQHFLAVWAEQFRTFGWNAILDNSANYTMPYLYFIALITAFPLNDLYLYKLGSIVFDCLLVLAALRLAGHFKLCDKGKTALALAVFWTPTVWLNSAYWGQCDAMYVFFCLMCLIYALEKRPVLSVVMAGIAFALKLQAIFFLPVLAVFWMAKKAKLWHFALFPLPYAVFQIPALITGCSLSDLLSVYVGQTEIYSDRLNLNSPSMYGLIANSENNVALMSRLGVILAFSFMLALLALAYLRRERLTDRALLLLTLAMVNGIPWLLPSMHDRYFYLGDVFVVLACFLWPRRWVLYPLQMFASYGGYHAYLFGYWLTHFGGMTPHALSLLAVLILSVTFTVKELFPLSPGSEQHQKEAAA